VGKFRKFRQSSLSAEEHHDGHHRFEHWYRDRQVYFITARCRDRFPAFKTEEAKAIFWDRFNYYTSRFGFVPWVTTVLHNHYHTIGYLEDGENLGPMMRHIHGSVAKLVNDLLPARLKPFWYDSGKKGYFDGCLRDVLQGVRTYQYTLRQAVRHGIVRDHRFYPHTRVKVEMDVAIKRAVELNAFMEEVPYARYERHRLKRDAL
jgi:hypothetical protein